MVCKFAFKVISPNSRDSVILRKIQRLEGQPPLPVKDEAAFNARKVEEDADSAEGNDEEDGPSGDNEANGDGIASEGAEDHPPISEYDDAEKGSEPAEELGEGPSGDHRPIVSDATREDQNPVVKAK